MTIQYILYFIIFFYSYSLFIYLFIYLSIKLLFFFMIQNPAIIPYPFMKYLRPRPYIFKLVILTVFLMSSEYA